MTRTDLNCLVFLGALALATLLPAGNASAVEEQWVSVTIKAKGVGPLTIQNAALKYGQFHKTGNKGAEIKAYDINGITIPSGGNVIISACGKGNAPSGTEGSVDIYDGATKIGRYYWDCPWKIGNEQPGTNTSTWQASSENHVVQCTGGTLQNAPLGAISITVGKIK